MAVMDEGKPQERCAFPECDRKRYVRGYCTAHYRQLTNGKPLTPLRDYVRQPAECKIADCTGKPHAHGYCKLHLNRMERHGSPEALHTWNPGASCKVEGCGEPVSARGYCRLHYMRVQRHGTPEATRNWNPGAECKVEGCGKPVASRGYCQTHYARVIRHGEPGTVESQAGKRRRSKYEGQPCAVEGCKRKARSQGWCAMHYGRWKRTGDPVGKWGAQPRKSQGYITSDGYRMITRDGKKILEHRAVLGAVLGRPLERFEDAHHKNGVRDDNRPGNLELWVNQPRGQRLSDLLAFIAANYPDEMRAVLEGQ